MNKQLQTVLDALENGIKVRNFEGGTKYQPALEAEAIIIIKQMMQAEPVAWWITSKTTDEKFVTTRPDDWSNQAWNKHPLYEYPSQGEVKCTKKQKT